MPAKQYMYLQKFLFLEGFVFDNGSFGGSNRIAYNLVS